MEKPSFENSLGDKVFINAFTFSGTYNGFISNNPLPLINNKIFDSVTYPKDWGYRKHIIKTNDMYTSKNVIKLYTVHVWLVILPVINAELDYDGKELVVTFFTNEIIGKTVDEIVLSEISFTHWENYAEKFLI